MIRRLIAATALAASVFALPALAETQSNSLTVVFAAENIASVRGAATALNRFESEARKACRYEQPVTGRRITDRGCAERTLSAIVSRIGSEPLNAAYADRLDGIVTQTAAAQSRQVTAEIAAID